MLQADRGTACCSSSSRMAVAGAPASPAEALAERADARCELVNPALSDVISPRKRDRRVRLHSRGHSLADMTNVRRHDPPHDQTAADRRGLAPLTPSGSRAVSVAPSGCSASRHSRPTVRHRRTGRPRVRRHRVRRRHPARCGHVRRRPRRSWIWRRHPMWGRPLAVARSGGAAPLHRSRVRRHGNVSRTRQ